MFRYFFFICISIVLSAGTHTKLEPVSIQLLWLDQFEFAGIYMAKEKGFYKEAGLDLEIKPYRDGITISKEVVEGKTTYAIANSSILVDRGNGVPVIALGAMFQSSPRAIAVKQSSNIKTINDLKHKRIMLTNDFSNDALIMAMLTSQGLKKEDFIIVPQSHNIKDLIGNKVDAMMVYSTNQPFTLKEKKIKTILFRPREYGFDFYADILYTSETEIKNHPERARAFYEATMRGWKYAYEHMDESVNLVFDKYNTQHKSKAALRYEAEELKRLSGFATANFGRLDQKKLALYDNHFHLLGMQYPHIDLERFIWKGTQSLDLALGLTVKERKYIESKSEVTMCTDPDWQPFESIDANGHHKGIATDFIKLIANQTHLNFKLIKTSTWEESVRLSQAGKCDIVSFLNQTPHRDQWLLFTAPLLEDPSVIMTRLDYPYIGSLNAIQNESIALPRGTMLYEKIQNAFPNLKIVPTNSEFEAMKMVVENKADMTMSSLLAAVHAIRHKEMMNLKISGQPEGYSNVFRIGIVKNEPVLRSILDKSIQTITSQQKEQIINQHTAIMISNDNNGALLRYLYYSVGALCGVVVLILLWNYLLRRKINLEIAKHKGLMQEYYAQSKQAEIGTLVANISHQWREPLSQLSAINLVSIAKLRSGQTIDTQTLLRQTHEIEETIDFMSQTMQNFLLFYKKSDKHMEFSILESLKNTLSIIETKLLDLNVDLQIEGSADTMAFGIKNEWMQVWLNIITNTLNVFSQRHTISPRIRIQIDPDNIRFCDNAGGLEENSEPSHGLGLNMCRQIIAKYKGTLQMQNNEGGLCVRIYFGRH